MASIIRSVSMNQVESDFLDDYELSPSALLKEKIWEMRGALKTLVANKIEKMASVIAQQTAKINELEDVLEEKGKVAAELS